MKRRKNHMMLLPVVLFLLVSSAPGQDVTQVDVRIAISMRGSEWINPASVMASSEPILEKLAGSTGLTYSRKHFVSGSVLLEKMKSGHIDLAFTAGVDYVKVSEVTRIVPLAISQTRSGKMFKLLLLVRHDSGITKIAQLKNKSISLYKGNPINLFFLHVHLKRNGIMDPETFFSEIRDNEKPQSAVLGLFLGETDSCIVSDAVLLAMAELNPQLNKRLISIHTSKPLVNAAMFVRADMERELMAKLKEAALSIHEDEEGRQILLINRIQKLVSASEADFSSTAELWNEYREIQSEKQ